MSDTKIKLINETTDIDSLKIRPLSWDIVINDRPYYACFIEGYVHSIGGHFGANNIWAYPRDEKPTYKNLIEFESNTTVCWGLRYEPKLNTKTKWDETRVYDHNKIVITRNGKDFCYCYTLEEAFYKLKLVDEHLMNLFEIDFDKNVVGRKIWWRNEPAIITGFNWGIGTVNIKPDGMNRFSIPNEFNQNDEDREFYCGGEGLSSLHTSIFDNHIGWFRH